VPGQKQLLMVYFDLALIIVI